MKETNVEVKKEEVFEEDFVDETKPERFARTKAFFAKHKKQVALAATGVAATVAGALVLKNKLQEQYEAGYDDGMEHFMDNDTSLDPDIEYLGASTEETDTSTDE